MRRVIAGKIRSGLAGLAPTAAAAQRVDVLAPQVRKYVKVSTPRVILVENVEIVFTDGVGYDTKLLLDSVKGRYGQY